MHPLTADPYMSSADSVQRDIISNLKLSPEYLLSVIHPFNRENLFYEVCFLFQSSALPIILYY